MSDTIKVVVVGAVGAAAAQASAAAAAAARDVAKAQAGAVLFTFDAGVDDADPGAGKLRFDNADLTLVTAAYVDNLEVGGADVTALLDFMDNSTNPGGKAVLGFKEGATGKVAFYRLTGAVVDGAGYRKLPLAFLSSSAGGFTAGNLVGMAFAISGDQPLGMLQAANNLSDLLDAETALQNLGLTASGRALVTAADYPGMRALLGLKSAALLDADADGTLGANSDDVLPTQRAVRTFVANAVAGLLDLQAGGLNAAGNPNYPPAAKGDAYIITAGGKVGGAAGKAVDPSDFLIALADNAGGDEAAVGASWFVLEHNLVGALLGANNLADLQNAAAALTNLGLSANGKSLVTAADYAAMRTLLSLGPLATQGTVCTWATKPGAPVDGQVIFVTDVGTAGTMFVYCAALARWRAQNGSATLARLGAAVSGLGNVETFPLQHVIPAGGWQIGDVVEVKGTYNKSGTTDQLALTVRYGMAGSAADAAIYSLTGILSATQRSGGFELAFRLSDASTVQRVGAGNGAVSYGVTATTAAEAPPVALGASSAANPMTLSIGLRSTGAADSVGLSSARFTLITP